MAPPPLYHRAPELLLQNGDSALRRCSRTPPNKADNIMSGGSHGRRHDQVSEDRTRHQDRDRSRSRELRRNAGVLLTHLLLVLPRPARVVRQGGLGLRAHVGGRGGVTSWFVTTPPRSALPPASWPPCVPCAN